MLVKDIITRCDTGLARGLNLQLIAKMNRMVSTPVLVRVNHARIDATGNAVNAYLQPEAAQQLHAVAEASKSTIRVNSMLRTTVQQHIIRTQFDQGLCGITAAARPGKGGHENGRSVDVQNPESLRLAMEVKGWRWLGAWDRWHYDYWNSRTDLARLQISAFQMLHNEHNPHDIIVVDGSYGPTTARCINNAPCEGWK